MSKERSFQQRKLLVQRQGGVREYIMVEELQEFMLTGEYYLC